MESSLACPHANPPDPTLPNPPTSQGPACPERRIVINIYVGNLPYKTSEADLATLFGTHGKVERASIVMDRETGRSRGFGFVEMTDHEQGTKAIEALAGHEWNGRPLTINEARPRGSGTTGSNNAGFTSTTTSFGESAGYANRFNKPADPTNPPTDHAADSLANEEAPVSRGYSNQLLNDE